MEWIPPTLVVIVAALIGSHWWAYRRGANSESTRAKHIREWIFDSSCYPCRERWAEEGHEWEGE